MGDISPSPLNLPPGPIISFDPGTLSGGVPATFLEHAEDVVREGGGFSWRKDGLELLVHLLARAGAQNGDVADAVEEKAVGG